MEQVVQAWDAQFQALDQRIAGHFVRSEPRRRALAYLKGLTSPCERKNAWQLAELAQETCPDGMQRLLNQAHWDADALRDDLRQYVVEQLSDAKAVLVIDETGFWAFSSRGANRLVCSANTAVLRGELRTVRSVSFWLTPVLKAALL